MPWEAVALTVAAEDLPLATGADALPSGCFALYGAGPVTVEAAG